jgi:hypothetical protein
MKNINWSMIVFSITQVELWIDNYEFELRQHGKALNSDKRVLIASLKSVIEKFNKAIATNKEDLLQYSGAISVINEMIAKAENDQQATVILESLSFLAKNTQVLTSNGSKEMQERLELISDMSDYLMNFPILSLRKLSKQVLSTPIKTKKNG